MKPRVMPSIRTCGKMPIRISKSIGGRQEGGGEREGRRRAPPADDRGGYLAAGGAIVSCLTILLSPHFSGLSLTTCSTKYRAFLRSPLPSNSISPVIPLCLTLRTAAATSSRLGTLPPLAAASMPFSAMAVASYASAAYG